MPKGFAGRVLCSVEGCGEFAHAAGFCRVHYGRFRRNGDPLVQRRRTEPWYERAVLGEVSPFAPDLGPCWLWPGGHDDRGYAIHQIDRRNNFVHRLAFERWVGPVPDGHELDHVCRVHGCWNPEHVEAVTHRENCRRGVLARSA